MNKTNTRRPRRAAPVRKAQFPDPWDLYEARRLQNGYDLAHGAGVFDGKYVECVAATEASCGCYGCRHGSQVPGINAKIVERRTSARDGKGTGN